MRRRKFFEKSGCGLCGLALSYLGMVSCKKEEAPAEDITPAGAQEKPAPIEQLSRTDTVKKMLVEKMGKTEEEATAMISGFKEKLPMVKDMCVCKTCPTYISEETEFGFCHALVGQSKIITEEKGCNCPTCPVYQRMGLKNGYYCTRKSEIEQELAKTA
ncbi:MAG: DUF2769 domain-containing protein [Candidatus Aminicenantes bacterium]